MKEEGIIPVPTIPELFALALKSHQAGDLSGAAALYAEILASAPGHADAWHLLGLVAHQRGERELAIRHIRKAVELKPSSALFHNNLGIVFQESRQGSAAMVHYREALRIRPDHAEAHNNLGNVFKERGQWSEAEACYRAALRFRLDYADAHYNLGLVSGLQWKLPEAVVHYREALRIRPDYTEAYNNLGNILKEQGDLAEAEACYRQSLHYRPDRIEIHHNLAALFLEQGKLPEAMACLETALKLAPHDMGLRLSYDLALPIIMESEDALQHERSRIQEKTSRLLGEEGIVADPVKAIDISALHRVAYFGENDLEVRARLAQVFLKFAPALDFTAAHCAPVAAVVRAPERKIKVGFISMFFHDHPIGKFYGGVIRNLCRERFHVVLLYFPGKPDDRLARSIRQSADSVVTLSHELALAQRQIAEQRLDVLFYPDYIADSITYFLAFARLAPVQCVSIGFPATTGVPAMDYYISDVDLEPADADRHYSEQLVRLRHFPVYFYRPRLSEPFKTPSDFDLDAKFHWYVCAQTLFKIHPGFDRILGDIMRADPLGRLILIQGQVPHWSLLLEDRLRRSIPGKDRIRFLPRQTVGYFHQLLAHADVLLDTIYFGGGTSTFEALATGTPIVTLPGSLMRGRVTYACYRKMGVLDCVAADAADYVRIAVRLANDPAWRQEVKSRILAANHVLFENESGIRELEQFFIEAVAKGRMKRHG